MKLNITTSTSSYQIVSPPVSDTPKAITAYSHMYEGMHIVVLHNLMLIDFCCKLIPALA